MNVCKHEGLTGLSIDFEGNATTECQQIKGGREQAMSCGPQGHGDACPRLVPGESLRSKTHKVRLTTAESADLVAMAHAAGMTVSDLIRRAALGQRIEARPLAPEINVHTYAELGRIGGNLNQLARWGNSGKLPPDFSARLAAALKQLGSTLQATRRELLGIK